MVHLALGIVELKASVVGLVTGLLYTSVRAPIPAPNVLGGILAIIGTFVGFVAVAAMRGHFTIGM